MRRLILRGLVAGLLLGSPLPASAEAPLVGAGAPTGRVVPSGLVGVSVETWHLATLMRRGGPCETNTFVSALARLGTPGVRVGGNSQDFTTVRPSTARFTIGTDYLAGLACVAGLGGPVDVGLNLRYQDAADTKEQMRLARDLVPPRQLTFSLGNEPDLIARFRKGSQAARYARYLRDYRAMRDALPSSWAPFRGPDYSTGRFASQLAPFVRDWQPATVDVHAYALSRCRDTPGSPTWPTVEALARKGSSSGLVERLRPFLALAPRVALSETNSVACSGLAGVSDAPVSAMWGADTIAAAAAAGLVEARFHLSTGAYDPLVLKGDGTLFARPLFNGMVFAAQHLPAGAQLAALDGTLPDALSGWATTSTVLLMNHAPEPQAVRVRVLGDAARVDTLNAGNTDPQGPVQDATAPPIVGGAVEVTVPPYGAVAVVTP